MTRALKERALPDSVGVQNIELSYSCHAICQIVYNVGLFLRLLSGFCRLLIAVKFRSKEQQKNLKGLETCQAH